MIVTHSYDLSVPFVSRVNCSILLAFAGLQCQPDVTEFCEERPRDILKVPVSREVWDYIGQQQPGRKENAKQKEIRQKIHISVQTL